MGILRDAEMFKGIEEDSLARLCTDAHRLQAVAGQLLFNAGDPSENLYLITDGLIRLTFPGISGNERTVATLDTMKSFGQAEFLAGRPFRYQVEALTDATLMVIPGSSLLAVGDHDPAVYRSMLVCMSRQFDALASEISQATRYSAFQRVVELLLRLEQRAAPDSDTITLPGKKHLIASRLGVAPETLSRTLANLSDNGLITVQGRRIRIHDTTGLEALLRDIPLPAGNRKTSAT